MLKVITTKLEGLNGDREPDTARHNGDAWSGESTQTAGQSARFKSASHASADIRPEANFRSAVRNALSAYASHAEAPETRSHNPIAKVFTPFARHLGILRPPFAAERWVQLLSLLTLG
ncbi:hypothetical protein [Bradyrhizobium paxllaeri]|uniref:hypothetical protein n=1 Tax=Bradyrhizobium paxllaeri TaxID=190148 RepID=UPI00114746D8|nr:hypothetical protein [Bradyrhizobium paxllaeri]